MALKKIKAGLKKVKKVAKAVAGGIREHGQQIQAIDRAAEKKVGHSGSRELDIQRQAKERYRMKKEQGVSLKKSIKKRLK